MPTLETLTAAATVATTIPPWQYVTGVFGLISGVSHIVKFGRWLAKKLDGSPHPPHPQLKKTVETEYRSDKLAKL